jgi:hypothetical protein
MDNIPDQTIVGNGGAGRLPILHLLKIQMVILLHKKKRRKKTLISNTSF